MSRTITSQDCEVLSRYPNSIPWVQVTEPDQKRLKELREKLKEISITLAEASPLDIELTQATSLHTPNGRSPREIWTCVFPKVVRNKSYGFQIALIISPRGAEICFCAGSGTSQITDASEKATFEETFAKAKTALRKLPHAVVQDIATSVREGGWFLRKEWLLEPYQSEFSDVSAWIEYAASGTGNGASISKYLSPRELDSTPRPLDQIFGETLDLFGSVLEFIYGESFHMNDNLNPAIAAAIGSKQIQELLAASEFWTEKARQSLRDFESYPGSPEFFQSVSQNFINSRKTFTEYFAGLEAGSPEDAILAKLAVLVSYIDMHAADKHRLNEYDDKRTLAQTAVRQNIWVDYLLRYRANGNEFSSETPPIIQNALSYVRSPATELTMLSEKHREMVSRNLLLKPGYDKRTFVSDVKMFFEPYRMAPANPDNLTRAISNVLYDFPEVKRLWLDGTIEPPEKPVTVSVTEDIKYDHDYRAILTAIKTKPFVLLAGLSGTGKSRLVRSLAFQTCSVEELRGDQGKPGNFELIPVKPNWHDSADLIGYVSRINTEKYITTSFLKFIAKAWKYREVPFFLCLDEMNLAPVEQYFAEYLSVIETRTFRDGQVKTDFLISRSDFENGDLYSQIVEDVGLKEEDFPDGISLPDNLVVVGTVNMDETTHSFSRKVLDRAMTFEMNMIDLKAGLDADTDAWSYPTTFISSESVLGKMTSGYQAAGFTESSEIITFLEQVNTALDKSPFKIAYRVRDEFLIYCHYSNLVKGRPDDWLQTALDEMTAMKILTRIEGDESKTADPLDKLAQVVKLKYKTSSDKIDEMIGRLRNGYTSYWS